jgi:hypothetical protein
MSTTNIHDDNNPAPAAPSQRRAPSLRKLAANRANAKKSTGPRTHAGKDTSKFNAYKHGLTAHYVCCPGESREDYEERRRQYFAHHKPTNILQIEALDHLVGALWAKQRYIRMEALAILDTVERTHVQVGKNYEAISPDAEAMLAFRLMSDETNCLRLLERYSARATREVRAAMQLFQDAMTLQPCPPAPPTQQPIETPWLDPQPEPETAIESEPSEPKTSELPNEANPRNEHPCIVPRTAEPISRAYHIQSNKPEPVKVMTAQASICLPFDDPTTFQ